MLIRTVEDEEEEEELYILQEISKVTETNYLGYHQGNNVWFQ